MEDEKMKGVIDGFYICRNDESDKMNHKIYERNVPDSNLEVLYDIRPVETKYVKYPILNVRPSNNVSDSRGFYEMKDTFNPGNAKGPYSGYVKNLDLENNLRNSHFGLQRCNQSVYVPDSTSDLFKETVKDNTPREMLSHPGLFHKEDFKPFNPDKVGKSYLLFNNNTRVQRNNEM